MACDSDHTCLSVMDLLPASKLPSPVAIELPEPAFSPDDWVEYEGKRYQVEKSTHTHVSLKGSSFPPVAVWQCKPAWNKRSTKSVRSSNVKPLNT